jgi:RNA polymerase sigma factor (sigma-70 family)
MERSERRDESRFWDELVHRHGRELERCVGRATRAVGWRAASEDLEELVQDVYCRLLERGDDTTWAARPAPQLWAYLHRTARSVVIDRLRSRAAKKRGAGARRDERPEALAERHAPGPSVEERLLACERAAELRRRVRELGGATHGERNLRILELAAVEGCTAHEIVHRLAGSVTASTVHTVLHRLRRQLAAAPVGISS